MTTLNMLTVQQIICLHEINWILFGKTTVFLNKNSFHRVKNFDISLAWSFQCFNNNNARRGQKSAMHVNLKISLYPQFSN